MGFELIQRSIAHTVFMSLPMGILVSLFVGLPEGLGAFFGALWGCLNLFLIKNTLVNLMIEKPANYLKILGLLGIKFPVLYGLGYVFLATNYLPPIYLLLGSGLIFLIIFTNSLRFLIGKTAILVFALVSSSKIYASLDADVPELPNFITFIYEIFHDQKWASYLKAWDTLFYSIGVSIILSLIFYFGSRKRELIPSGFQNVLETIVETLRNFISDILGPRGEKYIPLLGTLFLYILVMNWLVLIPFFKSPTSNFNITIALAICVFTVVQYLNIKHRGIGGFLYHLAGHPKDTLGWILVPLMFPIELLTEFTRPITLALRLFGNVVGEDILIGAFALFGVALLAHLNMPVGVPLQIPFMFLALLTGLMQALVFTLLSTIYILLSMPEEDEHSLEVLE